jgi:hypothetical protein
MAQDGVDGRDKPGQGVLLALTVLDDRFPSTGQQWFTGDDPVAEAGSA